MRDSFFRNPDEIPHTSAPGISHSIDDGRSVNDGRSASDLRTDGRFADDGRSRILCRREWLRRSAVLGGALALRGIDGIVRAQDVSATTPSDTPSDATSTETTENGNDVVGKDPVDLLIGGPLFDAPAEPEAWVLAHRKLGYRAAFAPPVSVDELPKIREYENLCLRHELTIAEVGVWNNLLDPDANRAAENMKSMEHGLALADELGARCCVNIAGSYNREIWFGPDPKNLSREFFERTVENARKLIDAVKPKRTKLAWEILGWSIPATAEQYLELMKAIDRPAFAVHLDPANAVNRPELFYDTTAHLNHLFDQLGPFIVSCHAKDLQWVVETNIHFVEVECGKGVMDFATYMKRVAELPQKPPVMLEHMADAAAYDRCREVLLRICAENGLRA
ncbi:MAG: TIM barrel protein [Planctomycetia bacterium]|nr:TIM barrel protein [Planctomycetia bacterium]